MINRVTETFFLPEAIGRQAWTLPADIYNLSRTLLGRSDFNCAFVPIRSMQYLAIITRDEIVFVDSQAYAYRDNEGGRLIMLVWKFDTAAQRDALAFAELPIGDHAGNALERFGDVPDALRTGLVAPEEARPSRPLEKSPGG